MNTKKVVPGFIWRYAEKSLIQLIDLGVNIILARQLAPEIFGTIAMVNIFNNILQVFVTSGLGGALIQKKDADELDFSSVFYFNIFASSVLYLGMFMAAPAIASFYNRPELISLTRVLCLTLIISGVKNIQNAYVSRNMLFKRFFFASLAGTLIAAICSVILAYRGLGAWSLVALQLFDTLIDTIVLWFTVKWRPNRMFSWERLKTLLSFGIKLLGYNLIDRIYENLRSLIIGKVYSASDLAFFEKGRKYPNAVYSNIVTTFNSVLFPTLSREQDNHAKVKKMLKQTVTASTYLAAPLLLGLAACANPIISIILTDKWLPTVPFLRLFCIIIIIKSINSVGTVAIKSLGLGNDLVRINIVKKAFSLLLIILTMNISVEAIAYSLVISAIFNIIVTTYPVKKHLGYGYSDLLRDVMPSILLATFMAGVVYCVEFLGLNNWATLGLQILIGAVIYIGGSFLFHMETPHFLIRTFKQLRENR